MAAAREPASEKATAAVWDQVREAAPAAVRTGRDPESRPRVSFAKYARITPTKARRRSVEGEVVLEIIVRRDGSVGDVKILKRLGAGLDDRAVQAVRQWRFTPARRLGSPVDVVVEVAVEFKLR